MISLRRTRRVVAAVLAVGLMAGAGLFGSAPASGAAKSTLTVAVFTQISTFNPFTAFYDGELETINEIYPVLVQPDNDSKPVPALADSWTTSADRLTWTFKIHPGLKWSDGQPLTAKDVAWTFNLMLTNKTAATANGSLVANFAKVSAPDDNTVTILTKTPQANMLYVVGLPIVPQHVWESKVANLKDYKNTDFPVVGYGPFTLTGYKTDQYATLAANKDYALPPSKAKFDTVILRYFANSDSAVAALKTGEIDQVDRLTATEYQTLKGQKGIQAYQQVGAHWTAVEINPGAKTVTGKKIGTGNPLLANPQVRLAIAYGIDRQTLVDKVYNGLGSTGAGYLPPAFPQWSWQPPADQLVGFDPAKANSILEAAGYPKGSDGIRKDPKTGKALSFRLGIHSDSISDSQIANYLVGWMKAIGIKLNLQAQSMTALNDNLAKGDWDLLMDGWGSGADPTYLLSIQTCSVLPQADGSGGNTDAFFCDPAYDKLYAEQQATFDDNARKQVVQQMEQILYKANDDIVLYYQNDLAAYRTDSTKDLVNGNADSKGYYPFQVQGQTFLRVAPGSSSSSSSSNTGVVIAIVVVVVVLLAAGGGLVLRRRATAGDRE
jgi:peptide/nickel transport system substrate-binding protein